MFRTLLPRAAKQRHKLRSSQAVHCTCGLIASTRGAFFQRPFAAGSGPAETGLPGFTSSAGGFPNQEMTEQDASTPFILENGPSLPKFASSFIHRHL